MDDKFLEIVKLVTEIRDQYWKENGQYDMQSYLYHELISEHNILKEKYELLDKEYQEDIDAYVKLTNEKFNLEQTNKSLSQSVTRYMKNECELQREIEQLKKQLDTFEQWEQQGRYE